MPNYPKSNLGIELFALGGYNRYVVKKRKIAEYLTLRFFFF